jgi:hypothetical protein
MNGFMNIKFLKIATIIFQIVDLALIQDFSKDRLSKISPDSFFK